VTSGIRLGTPAATSRGFGVKEFQDVADFITEALEGLAGRDAGTDDGAEEAVRRKVNALTARFPIY
jgi:glycine hydroxymethyltransferase